VAAKLEHSPTPLQDAQTSLIPKITAMNEIAGNCAAGFAFKPGYVTLGNCRLLEIGKIGKFSMRGKVCPVRYFDFTEEKSDISEPRPPRPL
jgi:hypothetical protein